VDQAGIALVSIEILAEKNERSEAKKTFCFRQVKYEEMETDNGSPLFSSSFLLIKAAFTSSRSLLPSRNRQEPL